MGGAQTESCRAALPGDEGGGGTGWEPRSASSAIMADCGKGRQRPGSLRCPLSTLRLMPAAQWAQEIGLWAGNRAGNRQQQSRPGCIWCPSRCYSGGDTGQTGWGEAAGGRCPSGILAVSEQTLTSSTSPVGHYDGPPSISTLEAAEGPCQANSRVHPPLLQNLCFTLYMGEAKLSYCW